MKQIVTTLILSYASISSFGQFKLQGHISNRGEIQQLVLNNPFVFGYAQTADMPLVTDKDGNFSANIPLDEEKIGYLRWGDHRAFLWMRPGTDLTVELDGTNGQITFGGAMADANAMLEELKLKDTPVFLSNNKRVAMGEMQDSVIQPYMEQLAAHEANVAASSLTPAEKEFLSAELHYHFVANVDFYVRTARWPRDEWSDFIIEFMQGETPELRSALRGPMFYSFLDAYVGFLASQAFSNRGDSTKFSESLASVYGVGSFDSLMTVAREHGETAINWLAVKRAFDTNTTERYLAKQVKETYDRGEVSAGNYLLQVLKSHHPHSAYLDTLISIQARLTAKMAAPNNDIIIPNDYRTFEHIKDFVKRFEGKVVYLDIWGTWCGPCKEEMRHLSFIKEQLSGKDVVFLYLDMDDDNHDGRWREYIHAKAITGVHLRKNREDIQPIWKELLPHETSPIRSYPAYFIFDKEGELMVDEVKRPSDGKDLVKQLEGYLDK